MSKGNKKKLTQAQRKTRTYQIVFIVISAIVLLTMIISLFKF
jgi:predicted nucleic acid-binding Zn ribbon protein